MGESLAAHLQLMACSHQGWIVFTRLAEAWAVFLALPLC